MKILLINLFIALIVAKEENGPIKRVLSFGGNGMIGSAVLQRMIKNGNYKVTIVSRCVIFFYSSSFSVNWPVINFHPKHFIHLSKVAKGNTTTKQ